MDPLPRGTTGSTGQDSRADDKRSEDECSSLSSLGASPIVSPRRIRRPVAAGRRGQNVTSPVSTIAGSDLGSDRISPNEQGSPVLIPSIDAIAGMRSLSADLPTSTNPETPDEAGCSETHDPADDVSESVSLTSKNKSPERSANLTSTDRQHYTNDEEGHEVDTVEGEWLPTRSGNDSPLDEHIQQADSTPPQETRTQEFVEIDQEAESAGRAMPTQLEQRLSDETNTTRASADLRKLLRQFLEVKHERDQVAEENVNLRIEKERLGNELSELTAVSHKHLQSSLVQEQDLNLAEEAAEEARTERDRSKESVLRMSEAIRKMKQENSKLDVELKSSSHEIWRLRGQLEKSERELQTFNQVESPPKVPLSRLGRVEAEADKIMTWIKKERDQQSRLFPKLAQFHSRHLLTLLNGTRARRRPPSFLPSPAHFHSLGDVISTTSGAFSSNRQSMISQMSFPVLKHQQSRSALPLPPLTQTDRTRSVHDCDPCRQQCHSYKRERAARTWTSFLGDDRTVPVEKLQQPLSTTDIIGASLSRPPTRIPIPISKTQTARGTRTYMPLSPLNPTVQLSRQYHGQSEVRSPTLLAAAEEDESNSDSPQPEHLSDSSRVNVAVAPSAVEGGFIDAIVAASSSAQGSLSPTEDVIDSQQPLLPQTEGTSHSQIHPSIISPSRSVVSSPMGTDLGVLMRALTDTALGVTHQATSSAVELPQSPGLKKRFSSSPQASPVSSIEIQPLRLSRKAGELGNGDVEASSSSQKNSKALVELVATQETTFDNIADDGTHGEQQHVVACEPGATKNDILVAAQYQTLPLRRGNASPTELRHRRPYSWDGAVHQSPSPSPLIDTPRNDFMPIQSVNGADAVDEETLIPGTIVDNAPLRRDTHSSKSLNILYSDSTDAPHDTEEVVQYRTNDTRTDELPPTPSLASASSHSGLDKMSPDELRAYRNKKLNPNPGRNPQITQVGGWPWEDKVYHPLFSRVKTNLDYFIDRFENAPSQALEVLFEPGVASLGLSSIYLQSEAFELHLDDESTPSSVGRSTREVTAGDQDRSHLTGGAMSGNRSREGFVDSSTDSELGMVVDGRPPTVLDDVHVYRFISESPIQYCSNHNILDAEAEAVSSSQSDDHESLLPSPLHPRATLSGTARDLSSPQNNKSASHSTTPLSTADGHRSESIRDRGPTYFLLASFLVYISMGVAFILFAYIAPFVVALPAVFMGSLTWILASVRTLTASMVTCGGRHHPASPSMSPVFTMPLSTIDKVFGGRETLTSFESVTLSVPGRVSENERETIKGGSPWTPFDEEFVPVSESSEEFLTPSHFAGGDETTGKSVSTLFLSVTSAPSEPSQVVESSRSATSMTLDEEEEQQGGDRDRDREREQARGIKAKHKQTEIDRTFAFSGPQHLDFVPPIRRFIDIVTFDLTVMMMKWDEGF